MEVLLLDVDMLGSYGLQVAPGCSVDLSCIHIALGRLALSHPPDQNKDTMKIICLSRGSQAVSWPPPILLILNDNYEIFSRACS